MPSHPSTPDPVAFQPGGPHHSRSPELLLESPPQKYQELAAQVVHGISPPPHMPATAGSTLPTSDTIQSPQSRPLGTAYIPEAETMNTCVPGIGTRRPGQFRGKGAEQVEKGPGEDDDVVDVQIGLNDHRRQTNAFRGGVGEGPKNQENPRDQCQPKKVT